MMKLSVIIVNYNVRHFLDQCLNSVEKALAPIEGEIFVVDNNSADGSVEMLREKHPGVKIIANTDNKGFSRANNQAIRRSSGEYVLLLNPDTVVEEDTFTKTVDFMDQNPEAGALGVKMIDGRGHFLPESKRGLPSPWVAFCKITGLTRLFPRSSRFARYYMGHLSEDETHKVEILAGAFMLIRRKVLDQTGLLDEDFFMYGEDIDLSYRIIKAGYHNYYYPHTRIIHYKGESTKRGSMNYVRIFYQAMVIFARKHFSAKYARWYGYFIQTAIWMRAAAAVINRFAARLLWPVLDFALLYGGLYAIKTYWEQNHRFISGGEYPPEYMQIVVPIYILLWLAGVFLSGGYDRPAKLSNILRGLAIATLILFAAYGLLSEEYRFSRAIILLGSVWAFIAMTSSRLLLEKLGRKNIVYRSEKQKRLGIVGSPGEAGKVIRLLHQSGHPPYFAGLIHMGKEIGGSESPDGLQIIGKLYQLNDIVRIYRLDELIFCSADLSSSEILSAMASVRRHNVEIRIMPPESYVIIGSHSIKSSGELYTVEVNRIQNSTNRRNKRLFDLLFSTFALLLYPLLFIFQRKPGGFFRNIFRVFGGKRSWVGYARVEPPDELPALKPGVLMPTDIWPGQNFETGTIRNLNLLYARDYKLITDMEIVWKGFRHMGRE